MAILIVVGNDKAHIARNLACMGHQVVVAADSEVAAKVIAHCEANGVEAREVDRDDVAGMPRLTPLGQLHLEEESRKSLLSAGRERYGSKRSRAGRAARWG